MFDPKLKYILSNFRQFFKAKLIFSIPILFLIIFYFYRKANKVQETFYSFTTFMLADEDMTSSGGTGVVGLAAQLGLAGGSNTGNKNMLKELMGSRKIIEHTLFYEVEFKGKKDLIINHYIHLKNKNEDTNIDKFFTKNYKVGDNEEMDTWLANIANEIKSNCTARITEAGLFEIFYSHLDEKFTKLFLDTHTQSISDYYIEKKTKKNSEIVKFAQRRVDSLSGVMSGKEMAVAKSVDNNILSTFSVNKVSEVRSTRNLQVVTNIYSEAVISLEMAKISLNKSTPIIQVVEDVRFPLYQNKKPIKKNLILGSIIGLVLSFLFLILWFIKSNFNLVMEYVTLVQEKNKSQPKIDF